MFTKFLLIRLWLSLNIVKDFNSFKKSSCQHFKRKSSVMCCRLQWVMVTIFLFYPLISKQFDEAFAIPCTCYLEYISEIQWYVRIDIVNSSKSKKSTLKLLTLKKSLIDRWNSLTLVFLLESRTESVSREKCYSFSLILRIWNGRKKNLSKVFECWAIKHQWIKSNLFALRAKTVKKKANIDQLSEFSFSQQFCVTRYLF